jgi:hypothetical protein
MLRQILRTIAGWFGFKGAAKSVTDLFVQKFILQTFEDRSAAASAAKATGIAALVRGGGREKWLLMKCPCGCGQQIALNLMQSHSPQWKVSVQSAKRFSIHPSVDATSCGAHFWLRDGKVIWC